MSEKNAIQKAIDFAIATEEAGAQTYTDLAKRFADRKDLQEAFTLLAKDEGVHAAQFKALRSKIPASASSLSSDDDKVHLLRAMAMSDFFDQEKGPLKALKDAKNVQDALLCVLGVEKATLSYYVALQGLMKDDKALAAIIESEKQHIARLMKYIVTDEKMKGMSDPF
jgi:rubrerythrin